MVLASATAAKGWTQSLGLPLILFHFGNLAVAENRRSFVHY